jgi:heterodisulfide reductase subunit A
MARGLERIGVFVCHCGLNIAGTVDVQRVVEEISRHPGVVHAEDYIYMCSEPGQELMRKAIVEKSLNGVINANCSPSLHEKTFRNLAESQELNPYCCEIANIREQCSWPHNNLREAATEKAISIIKAAIEKVKLNMTLTPIVVPLTKRALVIGAGIAGIQAALDIANSGYPVVLVERENEIGGHVNTLSETFPTLEKPASLLAHKIEQITSHPNITLYTGADVEEVSGYVGNFTVKIKNKETLIEEQTGAIIAATGYDLLPKEKAGYPDDPDIIDGLQLERILTEAETGDGAIRRPSDGKIPQEIVFVQCAGQRDVEQGVPYCSRVCCMYTARQASQYRKAVPEGQSYVFYTDIRSDAPGCEEFLQKVVEEGGVLYLRGEVTEIFRDKDRITVRGADTLSGKDIEVGADMVVLATAMVPSSGAKELARKLNIICDEYGFLTEAHVKLRPIESLTSGIFLAGTAQWPRDIPDTVASASGAASKVLSLFSRRELLHEPTTARVDEEICTGCGQCVSICTYNAIDINSRMIAEVNEVLCEGCGACSVTCPAKAIQLKNWSPRQFFEMINAFVV